MFHNKPRKINAILQTTPLTRQSIIIIFFDSIIYIDDDSKNIETRNMLGEMTDELSGKAITQFVSTGPKSYSFKYGDNQRKSAIKGLTFNHENSSLLNHDSLA